MKKVAVFGKPGSGKSTLSKALASASGIPLHPLDAIVFKPNGERVARPDYDAAHMQILNSERWIIDGFGPIDSFYQRLEQADTLIYIDLPYPLSYWLVTKRFAKGLFVTPEGWPEGSSIVKGSIESYKTLRLCPKFWNADFRARLEQLSAGKSLHIINSLAKLNHFVTNNVG